MRLKRTVLFVPLLMAVLALATASALAQPDDDCPGTVTFAGQTTGVADRTVDGRCLSDHFDDTRDWANRGQWVSHVNAVSRDLRSAGEITNRERSDLVSAAGRADIPPEPPDPDDPDVCEDLSDDPAGCQPSTFETPVGLIPGQRVNAEGEIDRTSSPEDAMAGAFKVAEDLGLFRNFEWLHWVPTVESEFDEETGEWSRGDLDGYPTSWGSRALGIAGDCLYVGHSSSTKTVGFGVTNDMQIYRIQGDPENDPPELIGTMPQLTTGTGVAIRDREARLYLYTSTAGRTACSWSATPPPAPPVT